MPKKIVESIKHNVAKTIDTETKALKDEIARLIEILEETPNSLNVYVEQVNALKYIDQQQEEFKKKFETIQNLQDMCRHDNIKVPYNVQIQIDQVGNFYQNLPKLCKDAKQGLERNKYEMERIMKHSSLALSKKIKAFEKKYVSTYLQDETRLEDCAGTLEELFKRSAAIHEIKSKVMLYKEFLKLLYENDEDCEKKLEANQLSCFEDSEFLQEVHKHTVRLWQMLLFWKKRR